MVAAGLPGGGDDVPHGVATEADRAPGQLGDDVDGSGTRQVEDHEVGGHVRQVGGVGDEGGAGRGGRHLGAVHEVGDVGGDRHLATGL